MHLNQSIYDCNQAIEPFSTGISLEKLRLQPIDKQLFKFARKSTQFKFLHFIPHRYPIPVAMLHRQHKQYNNAFFQARKSLLRTPTFANLDFQPANTQRFQLVKDWLIRRFTSYQFTGVRKKIIGIMGLILPLTYMASAFSWQSQSVSESTLDKAEVATLHSVLAHKQLRIATVNDATTYFAEDGFEHGFGYDVLRSYAHHLNVGVTTTAFTSEAQALAAVKAGHADMALTNTHIRQTAANDELGSVSMTCQQDYLSQHGLNSHVAVQMSMKDNSLAHDVNAFLCQKTVMATNKQLAAFYTQKVMENDVSQQHFNDTIIHELPNYKAAFQQTAKAYALDWELLVAMGYQESHLDADATSPTGVRGIMMLTNNTAEAMNVSDRLNATQSIQGGAKYLTLIQQQFNDVPKADRIWFALAAYNMGPQAVKNIQATLAKKGRNATSWAEVYRYMADNSESNSRFVQCMHYVTHIRGYLETLKLDSLNIKKIA